MDCTLPALERQPHTCDRRNPGPTPQCPRSAATPPDPFPPDEDACPTCGRAYALFDHDTSRLLDWVERLQQDLHHLKAALKEVLP